MHGRSVCCVQLFATPWTVAHQPPLSMAFSRQEYRKGLLFPSPGDVPDPGMELRSPELQADSLPCEPPGKRKDRDHIMGLTNEFSVRGSSPFLPEYYIQFTQVLRSQGCCYTSVLPSLSRYASLAFGPNRGHTELSRICSSTFKQLHIV